MSFAASGASVKGAQQRAMKPAGKLGIWLCLSGYLVLVLSQNGDGDEGDVPYTDCLIGEKKFARDRSGGTSSTRGRTAKAKQEMR